MTFDDRNERTIQQHDAIYQAGKSEGKADELDRVLSVLRAMKAEKVSIGIARWAQRDLAEAIKRIEEGRH